MIRVTSPNSSGRTTHYLAPSAIAQISETGPSSQWHGIRATVRTFEGRVIECEETASEINEAIKAAQSSQNTENPNDR